MHTCCKGAIWRIRCEHGRKRFRIQELFFLQEFLRRKRMQIRRAANGRSSFGCGLAHRRPSR
jgi:hypothetical protein